MVQCFYFGFVPPYQNPPGSAVCDVVIELHGQAIQESHYGSKGILKKKKTLTKEIFCERVLTVTYWQSISF